VHLDDELQPRESERPVAATVQIGGTEDGIPVFKIGSFRRRTARQWTNERSDRVRTAIGPNQQTANPLRAAGPSATSRPATLALSDGGPTASKLRRGYHAEPTREAESADRSAKVHLDDELQPRESERPVAATAQVGGTEDGIPVFKIGSSSRRTAHLRTKRIDLADGSDPGERKAANAATSDTLRPEANPLRSTARSKTYLRPHLARPQSPPSTYHSDQPLVTPSMTLPAEYRRSGWGPRTDQVTKLATVDKADMLAQDALLQPQSTIVSKVGTILSPPERNTKKIALALNVTSHGLEEPCLHRKASLPHESVLSDEEDASPCLPRATRQNRLPSTSAVAHVNALRTRLAVASVSERPQITTPRPLPREAARAEIKVLSGSSPSLRLAVRESRMVRSPENIVRVATANAEVCDVVQLNAREVAIVGKSRGTTKIEFWHEGIARASHTVTVGSVQATGNPKGERTERLLKLISYLFPGSRVELTSEEDRLIVRGQASSRHQAIDILSTIRRSQLVPVVDELVVQDD